MNKISRVVVVVLLLSVVSIVGYIFWTRNKVSSTIIPPEKTSIRLKWLDQAQFAGNYVAIEKGIYKKLGLDVSLIPFSFDQTTIDSVVLGKADFGIAGADEVLVARSQGKPVKAIAVIYKVNPGVFFTKKASGITKPQDFVGKKIGLQKGANTEYLYQAMMSKLGIDRKKITELPVGFDYSELVNGKVDASVGYIINRPESPDGKVPEMNTILIADYGVEMYADVIFTTDKMIQTKPAEVGKMVNGTLSGWQYAIENKTEAVDLTMKYAKDTTRSHQDNMLESSIPLINTGLSKIGWMDEVSWTTAQSILLQQKIIKNAVKVSDVFDNQFVEAVYKK